MGLVGIGVACAGLVCAGLEVIGPFVLSASLKLKSDGHSEEKTKIDIDATNNESFLIAPEIICKD